MAASRTNGGRAHVGTTCFFVLHDLKAMACVEPVTLLKRSDAEIFCFYSGTDWQATAERLSAGHCFDVVPILVAPAAPVEAQQHISAALKQSSVGAGWFACGAGVAVGALAAAVMSNGPLSARGSTELSAIATDPECSDDASAPTESALWDIVEPCNTAEASKASEVRASLQASFGKREASRLLGSAKTTVARGADGHKFRMLRMNGQALKLKTA